MANLRFSDNFPAIFQSSPGIPYFAPLLAMPFRKEGSLVREKFARSSTLRDFPRRSYFPLLKIFLVAHFRPRKPPDRFSSVSASFSSRAHIFHAGISRVFPSQIPSTFIHFPACLSPENGKRFLSWVSWRRARSSLAIHPFRRSSFPIAFPTRLSRLD
jgi:hypothetical protein